ncbi:MAG: histone deacetylase [Planctomycetes bacterium]|nr:histone deacetylase [Planctomycetota bacterium]
MEIFFSDHYELPLPAGHFFPMAKYRLLRQRLAVELKEMRWTDPPRVARENLLLAHDSGYADRVLSGGMSEAEIRRLGFPWSEALVERSLRSSGATVEACRGALQGGIGVNLAGGTHHAFRDAAEGYCLFNDSAIAALAMLKQGLVRRVLIIDTDVHQGNGTASILRDESRVFTFSIHGARNFPLRKETSDLDIALPDGADDRAYLLELERGLDEAFGRSAPDLVIHVSGADPYHDDRIGKLALTKEGLVRRDEMVYNFCRIHSCPVAVSMAGGYSRDVNDTAEIHAATVLAARRVLAP